MAARRRREPIGNFPCLIRARSRRGLETVRGSIVRVVVFAAESVASVAVEDDSFVIDAVFGIDWTTTGSGLLAEVVGFAVSVLASTVFDSDCAS